ncbi:MAG: VCBS domain-containing protein, partial [Rhodoferax sp.]
MNKPSLFELNAVASAVSLTGASAAKPGKKLVRRGPSPMALEQRFMFDGAAVADAVQVLAATPVESSVPVDAPVAEAGRTVAVAGELLPLVKVTTETAPTLNTAQPVAERPVTELFVATSPDPVLAESMAAASAAVRQFLESTSDEALFALFSGGKSLPDLAWLARVEDLRAAVRDGTLQLSIIQADGFDQPLAIAAFAAEGPGGGPTLFVARNGFGQLGAPDATRALAEEFGHAIDHYLNADSDSAGDEGERFAAAVLGLSVSETTTDDHGSALVGDRTYAIEYAMFDFVNAYAMVYDLNNNGAIVGSTGETDAAKEQNSHNFNTAGLGSVKVDDYNYNSKYFSGNDVNAIGLNIGGTTYFGWISRPIKSGGVVRGFYFWTDDSFSNLQLAQADGNQDGDSNTADNKGFLLVVDQAWFTQQIATSTSYTINNAKDGNLGAISVDNIGSSSDRVDSALNTLVDSNVAPSATNDTGGAALEQGYNANTSTVITATVAATGNILTNDTDGNSDTLSVSKIVSKTTGNSALPSGSGAYTVVGTYGTLTIYANGAYSYAVDNTKATVDALLSGSLSEAFTYTASDGKGGTSSATLTVQINGSNDAPVASNDYNVAKEITTTANTGFTATGSVLTNDSDVDSGDTKAIQGLQIDGGATIGTVTPTSGSATLSFTGDNGFTSVGTNQELYVQVGGTYRAIYASDGVTQVSVASKLESPSGSNNWVITLTATPSFYYEASGNQAITSIASFFNTNSAVLFENSTATTENTSGGKTATVSVAASTGYTTLSGISGISGTIAVGMTVTGPAITETTKVSEITYTGGVLTSIKLDKVLTSTTNGSYSFAGTGTLSQALQGAHGTLTLASSGAYTYTPTTDNPNLSSGQSAIDVFDYTMQDTAGVTSSAKLYITVYGSGTNDPNLASDTGSATETGVVAGSNASGNVLTNDTAGTGGTVASYSKADGSGTVNFNNNLTGTYGTLTISSAGVYAYTVNNANTAVDALLPGNTLTETFLYKVTNTAGGISFTRLVITITGTNDQPVAVADTAAVQEDGTLLATGNVLGNDTDVDSGDTKVVSKAGTSSAGTVVTASTSSDNGLSVTGTYGTLVLGADGTYSYTLNNSAANVQALAQGATADDVFTYEVKDTNGATHTNTLTITVTGANEAPINQFNGTAISSTATTSVTTAVNTAIDFTGSKLLSVADSDANLTSITLVVEHGALSFTSAPSSVTLSASSGASIKISAGTQAQLNAALALLRYTPDSNFYGTDFLTIMSLDGVNAFDSDGIAINIPTNTTATVSEAALSTGSTPSSTAETSTASLSLASGQSVLVQQTGNISDGSSNVIGNWQVNTNGTFSVTLTAASSSTSTSFSYVVSDSYGNSVNNTVTVSITDDGPSATANTKSVSEGSTATGNVLSDGTADTFGADGAKTTTPAGGVVGIRAAGGDTTTAVTTGAGNAITGLYGTLTLNASGSYSYVSNSNSVTTSQNDVFVYTIEDGDGTRSTATLTITVTDVGGATVVTGGTSGTGGEDSALSGTLTASDADGLTDGTVYSVSGAAAHGVASINAATGAWSYTPTADYNGTDSFTVTITDDAGNTATQAISLTVNAVADIVADSLTTNEDTAITANVITGTNGASADNFEGTPVLTGVTQGANGTVSFTGAGNVTYTPNANYNGSDSFSYTVTSPAGVTETTTVNVTVTAVNDTPVIGGDAVGAVTEDAATPTLTDSGTLTITDADTGEAGFQTTGITASAGALGSLSITSAGVWSYSVPNSSVQYLAAGQTKTETFTVKAIDGSTKDVVVTITGVNDSPVIGGDAVGAVTEDAATPTLTDSGTLSISDADTGEAGFQTSGITASAGALGSLSITSAGVWSYAVPNASVQYLGAGQTKVETFTVKAIDGSTKDVVVTITGVNDAPVIGGDAVGAVTEDAATPTLTDSGTLTISDADTGEAGFQTSGITASAGALGSLSITSAGVWSYSVPNSSVQYLKAGETKVETFTVKTLDGSTKDVVVTITGVNDSPVIGGDAVGAVTEDVSTPTLTDSGTLSISDADTGEAGFQTSGITASAGALGSLSITSAGVWSYSVANTSVQYLKAGETKVETFTVKAIDGSTKDV